jgi:hypothetical protein
MIVNSQCRDIHVLNRAAIGHPVEFSAPVTSAPAVDDMPPTAIHLPNEIAGPWNDVPTIVTGWPGRSKSDALTENHPNGGNRACWLAAG